jgi:hypothetical protein
MYQKIILYFTTYFDKNYLSRGLVLIESLQQQTPEFELYVLCLDDFTTQYFIENKTQYPQIILLSLSEIEKEDEELFACKGNRSMIEYYFTLSPCLPLFLLKKYALPHICSLDADIKFYASPDRLFDLSKHSIVITPHKFSQEIKYKEKSGKNNVSFQIFKNDSIGISCLELWRELCIDWCKDELDLENDRFADQKYLDNWEQKYAPNIKILNDNVSGLASWNLNNFVITEKDSFFNSNDERIIFYHFHHNKLLNKRWATNGFHKNQVKNQKGITEIYKDYWNNINKFNRLLKIKQEIYLRTTGASKKLPLVLLEENSVFLRLSKGIIVPLNFSKIPFKIRNLIRKMYA